MSIRYECPECGSVLKIKESLAGTDGKCPKCKTPFVVPTISSAAAEATVAGDDTSPGAVDLATVATPATSKSKGRAKIDAPPAQEAEFDPVAFLMEGGAPPKSKAKSPPPAERGGLSLDDGEPSPQPKSRSQPSQPAESPSPSSPPTAAASAKGLLSASSNAKDLLTRTVEESRARAAEMPQETKVPFIDTAQLRMLLFTRVLPIGGGVIVLCGVMFWIASSIYGTGDLELPDELVDCEGVVLINGERVEGVVVTMRPAPDKNNDDRRWRTSMAVTNAEGEFKMVYLEGYDGIVPGLQQVALSYVVDGLETINDDFSLPGRRMEINEATYDLKLNSTALRPERREQPEADDAGGTQ